LSIDEGMVALLRTKTSVMNLLPGGAASVAVGTVDQSRKPPFVVISDQSTDYMNSLTSVGPMRQTSLDFDCVATSKVTANRLAATIEEAIGMYTGIAGEHTVKAVILDGRGSDTFHAGSGTETIWYITTVTAEVQYE